MKLTRAQRASVRRFVRNFMRAWQNTPDEEYEPHRFVPYEEEDVD